MKLSTINLGILAAVLSGGLASAAETTYGAGAQFNPLRQEGGTARAMGMGSAVVGVRQDSASLLWNPAGLGYMSAKEVGLHHNSGLGDTVQEIAVFGMPLGDVKGDGQGGEHGGLAVSLGYVNYGNIAGADDLGRPTGFYGANDLAGSVGWGKQLMRNVSAGVSLKASRSSFGGKPYYDLASDLGVLWNVVPEVHIGAAYSNIPLGGATAGAITASGLRLGAGWDATKHWLLAASTELQYKAMKRIQFGTEYLIGDVDSKANVLALRGGYQLDFPNPGLGALNGMTLGLGYAVTKSMTVDYAFLPAGDLGASHRLSLTLKFNSPGKAAPVAAAAAATPAPVVKAKAPVVKMIVLEDSHFDFDKSTLRPEGMKALRENIALMKNNPNTQVRVAGYTSMSGTAEYNQRLSERRASAVRDFMISEGGIDQSRISVIGYGSTKPKTKESDPSDIDTKAAQSNMRVLFEMSVK